MPYTEEPAGLAFINNINSQTAGSLVTNFCWLIGSLTLTRADYLMLTSTEELARQGGLFLAGILVGAWLGKTTAGVVDAHNKRKSYAPVVEAEARKAEAEAITREHAAPAPVVVTAKGATETEVKVGEEPSRRVSGETLPVGIEQDRRKPSRIPRNPASDKPRPMPQGFTPLVRPESEP